MLMERGVGAMVRHPTVEDTRRKRVAIDTGADQRQQIWKRGAQYEPRVVVVPDGDDGMGEEVHEPGRADGGPQAPIDRSLTKELR
jgi:hypothetical protein